jgi:hypothetical protein
MGPGPKRHLPRGDNAISDGCSLVQPVQAFATCACIPPGDRVDFPRCYRCSERFSFGIA